MSACTWLLYQCLHVLTVVSVVTVSVSACFDVATVSVSACVDVATVSVSC